MGLQKEQYAEWRKGHLRCYCNEVWTMNGGRIPWNVTAICETFKISCLMGGHHMKGGSRCHSTDQWYRFEQWSNITLSLRRTHREYINFVKNLEIEPQCQKYKGRVVLRGDNVKDDSGSFAVFTEQGSSSSQMIISRLPGCAGQAADAVSAYSQVKTEDAPTLLKIPKSECPGIWIRLPKHKWPKSSSSMEDLVVNLERNLYGHPLAGLLWEKAIWESSVGTRLGMLWTNFARAVTKWTKSCDKHLARLIAYIHHTCEYKQYRYVGNTAKQCR